MKPEEKTMVIIVMDQLKKDGHEIDRIETREVISSDEHYGYTLIFVKEYP